MVYEMEKRLRITKFVKNGKYLYFLIENISILGRVDIFDGTTDYFLDTPEKIVGKPAYYFQLFENKGLIYIIENSGKFIYQYNPEKEKFIELLYDENNTEKSETCAGIINGEEISWVLRDGRCIKWNVDKNSLTTIRLNMEHVAWVCGEGDNIWLLNYESDTLYYKNLNEDGLLSKCMDLKNIKDLLCSNTSFPIHGMCMYDGRIYIHDVNRIYEIDVLNKNLKLIHEDMDKDSGARILPLADKIVVPSFYGNKIKVISINGELLDTYKAPVSIRKDHDGNSVFGQFYVDEKCIVMPATEDDKVFFFDRNSMEFNCIKLINDNNKIKIVNHKIAYMVGQLTETSNYNLNCFLEGISV